MLAAFRGGRLGAMAAGLALSLLGAVLFAQDSPEDEIVGNKTSKTYHRVSCESAKKITEKNKVELLSADEAKVLQLKPCPVCKPPGSPPPKGDAKAPKKTPDADESPDGEMKPEKAATPAKSTKGSARKAAPKSADASAEPADGEMKPGGAMPAKGKGAAKRALPAKGSAKKADGNTAVKVAPKDAPPAEEKGLKFSEDIAPILAGNCARCHNPQQKRGGFDLSNFQKLMAGSKRKVIVPGKPDESELVLRIKGESDGPKMPPGQANLAPETIAKIEEWVKSGARLNAGVEPTANLDAIAPSPEARRKKELARLSPEERDKKLVEVGIERWKKATTKAEPTVTPGKNFQLLSNLPKERAERLLKTMEAQRTALGGILGREGSAAISGTEKISLYVFNDLATYVEFVRSVENRELEPGIESHGKLDVEQPYLAAADPLGGGEESAAAIAASSGGAAKKAAGKAKKAPGDDPAGDGPDRTLAGMLSEGLASSAALAGGKPPRWLIYGLGAYLAKGVEPRGSGYYAKMRNTAYEQVALGWETKATEALGGEGNPETVRALGFSLCEWLASTSGPAFPAFVQGMLAGQEKLDDGIRYIAGPDAKREDFLRAWGQFVAAKYGRRR